MHNVGTYLQISLYLFVIVKAIDKWARNVGIQVDIYVSCCLDEQMIGVDKHLCARSWLGGYIRAPQTQKTKKIQKTQKTQTTQKT